MKQLLSVWLVPKESDKNYLQTIIQNLAKEYDSPSFTPHLTLISDTNIKLNDLIKIIDEVFEKTKAFKIQKTNVSQSELFFKTVFIEFELNENLKTLFNNLSEKIDKRRIEEFNPHISLIYKKMSENEKLNIIKNLSIKNDFIIDKVVINAPGVGQNDFMDISSWRNVYEKKLNY